MIIFGKYSKRAIQKCLQNFPSSKINGDINCQKDCGKIIKKTGCFVTILPPLTAMCGKEMIIFGKYSESAFQNCLKKFSSSKIMGDMNF